MTENNINSNIQELVIKYLHNETTEEETQFIKEKLNIDSKLYDYYKTVSQLLQLAEGAPEKQFDSEHAKKKFYQHINTEASSSPQREKPASRRPRLIGILSGIAASIAILAGIFIYPGSEKDFSISAADTTLADTLPDGSIVSLKKGSDIIAAISDEGERIVYLDSGEVYFDVVHSKDRLFKVITSNVEIAVLGTSFNVQTTNQNTNISLFSGSVRISSRNSSSTDTVLAPGQACEFKSPEQLFTFAPINQNTISWKTKTLVFNDTPAKEVINEIEEFYSIRVQSENEAEMGHLLTATFNNQPLEVVLSIISASWGVEVVKQKDCYKIVPSENAGI